MLPAIKKLEAEADVRMEQAANYGKLHRRMAEKGIIPLGLRTLMQQQRGFVGPVGRIEATLEKFVNP